MSQYIEHAQPRLGGQETRLRAPSSYWVLSFVAFQIACQIALLFSVLGSFRIVVRAAAFAASLVLLLFLPGRRQKHPASQPAWWVLAIIGFSNFHPTTNSLASGIAQTAMYFAILGPLFWVPRLCIDMAVLRSIMLMLLVFHTLSAALGVVQVYYPGRFQPNLSSVIAQKGKGYVESLQFTLASGERVFRPMGLTDVPGGAATAGFYTVLLGMGFFLSDRRFWLRTACVGSMILGMMCLYLSHVRSLLVMTLLCMVVFVSFLARRHVDKLTVLTPILGMVVVGSFYLSILLGGKSVSNRVNTLVEDQPNVVYYQNRGHFLEDTINELLPQYPFGAGLGRWGIMNTYFGNNSDPESASIWVEIQWTGWLLDGGVPLILAYTAALFLAFRLAWQIALRPASTAHDDLWLWGAILLAYNIGALAVTFNYPLFIGQGGLEFWLLNGVLFAAASNARPVINASQTALR
jgi:hypothetical protein